MGTIIDLGLAPPHDPMLGISSSNIVCQPRFKDFYVTD
jgi:hypothetical protein